MKSALNEQRSRNTYIPGSGVTVEPVIRNQETKELKLPIMMLENTEDGCMAKTIVALELSHGNHEQSGKSKTLGRKLSLYNVEASYVVPQVVHVVETIDSGNYICKSCRSARTETKPQLGDQTAEANWQCDLVTPVQRLSQLLTLGHLTDVRIEFPNSEIVYKAHRLILASASPVFECMFYNDTKEAATGVVRLHNCSPVAIKWVLDNLYLGNSDLDNVLTAIMVYDVAQMYQLTAISVICTEFLKYEVSLTNLTDIFEVALTHSEGDLIAACIKKLTNSWPEMLKEHMADMTESLWLHLLKRPVLPTAEVQLFKGLVLWANVELEKRGKTPTPTEIRSHIAKFLPHLRLLSIPSDKFIDYVMPTNVFTPAECHSILLKLRGFATPLTSSVKCSPIPYSRVDVSEATLRYAVLTRMMDNRKVHPNQLSEVTLIKNFSVSSGILLSTIHTQDNATLKYAQMVIQDTDGRQAGVAKAIGSQWKFLKPVYIHANRTYNVIIDKVLVNKAYIKRDFCTYASDVRFKGTTGDNFLKLAFWPTQFKS